MSDPSSPPTKPTVASDDFRRFAVDSFSLRLSNHSAQLSFLLETTDTEERELLLKEATAVMSLSSLKVLQIVLTNALAVAEKQFGQVVLPPGKEEELRKVIPLFRPAGQPPVGPGGRT